MKLCAYTICKNEIKHIDNWVNGLKNEVDYICVLDTGSTDGTVEKNSRRLPICNYWSENN